MTNARYPYKNHSAINKWYIASDIWIHKPRGGPPNKRQVAQARHQAPQEVVAQSATHPLVVLTLLCKSNTKEGHGDMSNPLFGTIRGQKHRKEVDICRSSISHIKQFHSYWSIITNIRYRLTCAWEGQSLWIFLSPSIKQIIEITYKNTEWRILLLVSFEINRCDLLYWHGWYF